MSSAKHTLWYVRRGQRVTGPFPEKVITEHLLLGRLTKGVDVSVDGKQWRRLGDFPQLIPDVMIGDQNDPEVVARLESARRWADERLAIDRRTVNGPTTHPNRRGGDRRVDEPDQIISHRKLKTNLVLERRQAQGSTKWLMVALLMGVGGVLFWVVFAPTPVSVAQTKDCKAPPIPGVHWGHCDLRGSSLVEANMQGMRGRNVDLSGSDLTQAQMSSADLAFANLSLSTLAGVDLSSATLMGANFQSAVLSAADLSHADASYADFRGADLMGVNWSGTMLGRAIWPDGRVCSYDSVGECIASREPKSR